MNILQIRILLIEAFGEKAGKSMYTRMGKKQLLIEAQKDGPLKTALNDAQKRIDEREANWTPLKYGHEIR